MSGPKAWLTKNVSEDLKLINQQANFALIEWPDNIDISDRPPINYVPDIRSRFKEGDWAAMHELHALPQDWHAMDYESFLEARRKLMAGIVRRGFESLK